MPPYDPFNGRVGRGCPAPPHRFQSPKGATHPQWQITEKNISAITAAWRGRSWAARRCWALIGLFTVLGWVIGLVRSALDDSSLRDEYHDRLYGMVMLDPVAFDDVSTVDEGVFKQAAIWGTVYQVQNSGGSLDQYERDPDTGSALIPALEIDTYISNLLGPDYQVTEGSFSTSEFVYQYDEEKQAYYVPVTSSVALYTPTVEMISQKDGERIVTVGYVPTATNNTTGELSLMAPPNRRSIWTTCSPAARTASGT